MPPLILFIDNDPAIARIVSYNLEMEGFEVVAAGDAESGLSLSLTRSPDLVILDPNLPRVNGRELCAHLRRRLGVPIIVLTTRPDWLDLETIPPSYDSIIAKPFSLAHLVKKVKGILRHPCA